MKMGLGQINDALSLLMWSKGSRIQKTVTSDLDGLPHAVTEY